MANEEFDVAISLISADCTTAEQIADSLSPLNVFFFLRSQEEVAGTPFRSEHLVLRDAVKLAVNRANKHAKAS